MLSWEQFGRRDLEQLVTLSGYLHFETCLAMLVRNATTTQYRTQVSTFSLEPPLALQQTRQTLCGPLRKKFGDPCSCPSTQFRITQGAILNMYIKSVLTQWHDDKKTLIFDLSFLFLDYNLPEAKSISHTFGFSSRSMIHTPSRVMSVSTACQYCITL